MYQIEAIDIIGAWAGTKNWSFSFECKDSFLFGQNGTGKTTIIRYLAAALRVEKEELFEADFEKLVIVLKDKNSDNEKVIEITKPGFLDVQYKIKDRKKNKVHKSYSFMLDNSELQRGALSTIDNEWYNCQAHIRSICKLSWLPITRMLPPTRSRGPYLTPLDYDRNFIDQKFRTICEDIASKNSINRNEYASKTQEFQKDILKLLLERGVSQQRQNSRR